MEKSPDTSQVEIQYLIPSKSRLLGDFETIVHSVGSFQNDQVFPIDLRYETRMSDVAGGGASVRLIKTIPEPRLRSALLEESARMQRGVETHFPEGQKDRLMRHFVGIAIRGSLENE